MPLFGGISAAVAIGGLALSAAQAAAAKKKARQAEADQAATQAAQKNYVTPQSVNDQLADATSKYGAPNAAILQEYQQAQQAGADQASFAQRNAGSGQQALAVADQAAAQTRSILPTIAMQQAGLDQQNRAVYVDALKSKTEDSRAQYQDQLERNQAAQQFNLGRLGAANQDKSQAIGLGLSALSTGLGLYGQFRQPAKIPVTEPATTVPTTTSQPTTALTPLQRAYYSKFGTFNFNPYRVQY